MTYMLRPTRQKEPHASLLVVVFAAPDAPIWPPARCNAKWYPKCIPVLSIGERYKRWKRVGS